MTASEGDPSAEAPEARELVPEAPNLVAPEVVELSVEPAQATGRFEDPSAAESEAPISTSACWCEGLLEDFDQQVMNEARRWEFTLRLLEERERRDVEEYVARFLLEQRKREFTRRLIEGRLALRAREGSAR